MKNLILMTDFVLELDNNDISEHKIESIFRYANFLKQPLELWMFVEKENCLFKWFEYYNKILINNKNHCFLNTKDFNRLTVESLIDYNLELTPKAIKKIGL